MSNDTLERLRKVAPLKDHREFTTVRLDLLTAAAKEIEWLQGRIAAINRMQEADEDKLGAWGDGWNAAVEQAQGVANWPAPTGDSALE